MATDDRTLPADGFYWLQQPHQPPEVVRVLDGEVLLTGTGMQQSLSYVSMMDGVLTGPIPQPGAIAAEVAAERERYARVCEAVARRLEAEGVHVRTAHEAGPQDGFDWCAEAIRGSAPEPASAMDRADLLRRYIAHVKACSVNKQGADCLGYSSARRAFSESELALLKRLSEEAMR